MTPERILVVTSAVRSDQHALIAAARRAANQPRGAELRVLTDVEDAPSSLAALRARVIAMSGGAILPEVVAVRAPVVTAAAADARAWGADLAVIGAGSGRDGRDAERLVHLLRLPVLVARPFEDGGAIVCGTDLVAPGFPVVRAAAAEATRDATTLLIVHALEPRPHALDPGGIGTLAEWADERHRAVARRLERARDAVGTGEISIVEARTAEAIDEIARARRAAVIVVGTRAKRARGALVGRTAEAMIRHGRCSVLVIPIADDAHARVA